MPNALGLLGEARMQATPRNKLMGLLADALTAANDYAQKPDPTMPMGKANPVLGLLADAASLNSLATTAQRASYGEPLTNRGKANVAFLKPETADALMMAPLSPRNALAALGMVGGMADNGAMRAATVWHGSPHKFDKFDASKIGTGEGAQAYGHGLYLAESQKVADSYRSGLTGREFLTGKGGRINARSLAEMGFNDGQARVILSALANSGGQAEKAAEIAAVHSPQGAQFLRNLVGGVTENPTPGSLYKVDLPDDAIAKMLDYDRPLSEQAPAVMEALNRAGLYDGAARNVSGNVLHDITAYISQRDGRITTKLKKDQAAAAEALRQAGIPGIRYLDGGSRGAGKGSSNFVVFPGNEGLLSILERNGQPVR